MFVQLTLISALVATVYLHPQIHEAVCDPVCEHGGTCTSPNKCNCPPGYTGEYCQTAVCDPLGCLNGGTCIGPNSCLCMPSYAGSQHCETPVCNPVCLNGGTCTSPNKCNCPPGYTGEYCQTPVCDPVCEHGGTCTSPNKCNCPPEYTGNDCQILVCDPVCEHGGTCTSPNKCNCPAGYTGEYCQTECPRGYYMPPGSDECLFLGCPDGFFSLTASNQCYTFFPWPTYDMNWEEAKAKCEKEKLVLARPYDAIAMRSYLVQRFGYNAYAWLNARANGTDFLWQDDNEVIHENNPLWNPNSRERGVKTSDCLMLWTWDWKKHPTTPYNSNGCEYNGGALCQLYPDL